MWRIVLRLSREQVNSWRLNKQHLVLRERREKISEVVSDICGVQAQVLSAAELAIRARVQGITQGEVRDALWKDHSIVKTWCMRGTLHLLPSSDLPTYIAAMRTELSASLEWLQRTQGVQPSEVEAITAEIRRVLDDSTVTREDLVRRVESKTKLNKASREALRSAWGILLRPAAYQGALAFGPSVGPRSTFFRPDRWVRYWREPTSGEAFSELFLKFVECYGPVTTRDFAHWWGNPRIADESILETNRDNLEEVQVRENRGWMLRGDPEEALRMKRTHVVRLLPNFDCYVMFYSPREAFVEKAHRSKIFRQTAGWNYPALVVDGFAAGIWSLRRRSKRIDIILEPFRGLTSSEKARIQEEAADIGEFYGQPVEVRYIPSR